LNKREVFIRLIILLKYIFPVIVKIMVKLTELSCNWGDLNEKDMEHYWTFSHFNWML
jgi:hypothetical protein